MIREEREEAIYQLERCIHNAKVSGNIYSHFELAIEALKVEPCEDAVSRQAVEDKLLKLCNELEGIFANIRMEEVDDCVCGLCEYDCDHGIDGSAFECPGFETDECFKLADEIRHEWQSTKDLPLVNPQPKTGHWINHYDEEAKEGWYECDCCHTERAFNTDFCPDCGARMFEPQETETWNGIHAQITAPKGTFERIFNDADDEDDI